MPQLDVAIWYMLVCSTTFLFWIVYVLSLIIYREFINSQGYIIKLKQLLIYSVSSVLFKYIVIFKNFFRNNNIAIIEEIWTFFSSIPYLNWVFVLQNIFLYSSWKNYINLYSNYIFILKYNWFDNFFYDVVRYVVIENTLNAASIINHNLNSFNLLSTIIYNFWREFTSGLYFFILFQNILLNLNQHFVNFNIFYFIESSNNKKISIISFNTLKDF